jgi:site-specific DNA recombinase
MRKAVGYIRVSTEGQAVDGVSLDAQRAKVTAWAELNGYEAVFFMDAGISGGRADNREALQNALNTARAGDALVVYSLSRLSRSTRDTIEIADHLERKGADLVSLSERIDTTNAAGKMVFRMLAVLNEFERDQISDRTKAAMQYKKSKNERVGSIPYGYELAADGIHITENEAEQEIVATARKLRDAGLSLRAIATELSERGFTARNDKAFQAVQINRMLKAS